MKIVVSLVTIPQVTRMATPLFVHGKAFIISRVQRHSLAFALVKGLPIVTSLSGRSSERCCSPSGVYSMVQPPDRSYKPPGLVNPDEFFGFTQAVHIRSLGRRRYLFSATVSWRFALSLSGSISIPDEGWGLPRRRRTDCSHS